MSDMPTPITDEEIAHLLDVLRAYQERWRRARRRYLIRRKARARKARRGW